MSNISKMIRPNYYLSASSTFFIAPALFGLYKGYRVLPLVSVLTTAASINYWLDPTNENKRKIDFIVSKSCGLIYFMYGYNTVESIPMRILGYTNLFMILSTYQASCIIYNSNNKNNNMWIPFHIMFHYLASLGKFLVISMGS